MWGWLEKVAKARTSRYILTFSFLILYLSAWEDAWDILAPCFSDIRLVLREIRLELNQVRCLISVALVNVQVAGDHSSKEGGRGLNKEPGGVQSSLFSLAVHARMLLRAAVLLD